MKNQILTSLGLNWEIQKFPLSVNFVAEDGTEHQYDKGGHYGIVRMDNKEILATCKESYTAIQNSETIDLLFDISQRENLEIQKGGEIDGGKKIFVQMKDPNGDIQIGKDTLSKYIFAINSHDGSTSLAFGTSNLTWSCQNQFFKFYRRSQIKVRHTSNYQGKLQEALRVLELGKQNDEVELYSALKEFAQVQIKEENIRTLILSLEGVDLAEGDFKNKEIHSTNKLNKVNKLLDSIHSEMDSKGKSLWGLFSGVTYFTNHIEPAYKRVNGLEEKLILGGSYQKNLKAFELVSEML